MRFQRPPCANTHTHTHPTTMPSFAAICLIKTEMARDPTAGNICGINGTMAAESGVRKRPPTKGPFVGGHLGRNINVRKSMCVCFCDGKRPANYFAYLMCCFRLILNVRGTFSQCSGFERDFSVGSEICAVR